MTGKFIAYVIFLFTFFNVFLLSISLYMHIAVNERVNDICYDTAETISTKGKLSTEIYDYLLNSINCLGEYEVEISLEKKNEKGNSTFLNGIEQIQNINLSTGDRLVITAKNKYPTFFSKISGSNAEISVVKVAIIN